MVVVEVDVLVEVDVEVEVEVLEVDDEVEVLEVDDVVLEVLDPGDCSSGGGTQAPARSAPPNSTVPTNVPTRRMSALPPRLWRPRRPWRQTRLGPPSDGRAGNLPGRHVAHLG